LIDSNIRNFKFEYCKSTVKSPRKKTMKNKRFILHPVFIFVMAQLAWLSLLGLWIYWYVSNYIILEKVGDKLSPQIIAKSTNLFALIWGLILLVFLLVGMYFIFIYLTKQINITKLYDDFIASMTHELKSPLASIQLYLETMKMRDIPKQKQREFIDLMIDDASRLKNLINSILNISGIEQNKMIFNCDIHEAQGLIQSFIDEAIEKFRLEPFSVNVDGKVTCTIVCDPDALKIVIDNLFDNAIKYSTDSVDIHIHLSRDNDNFIMEFQDKGIGFTAKERKKIFNKFHRVIDSNKPNVKGTGLGLYISREIIKAHGGKITAFSEGYGKGALFRIELPIYPISKKRYVNQLLKIKKAKELTSNVQVN